MNVATDHSVLTMLTNGKGLSSCVVHWSLKLEEYNVNIDKRHGKEIAAADALSRSPKECMEAIEKVNFCVLSSLVLRSWKQLIQEQKDDVKFGDLYSYLENPHVISSLNAAMFQCSYVQSFKLIDDFLFQICSFTRRT